MSHNTHGQNDNNGARGDVGAATASSMCSLLLFLVSSLLSIPAVAVPFWGAKESSPAETAPAALKPGQFVWDPSVAPDGPMVVVVSLTDQRAYVYRNGVEIGFTTVSTGKPGHETPTGIFTILQKDADHHSSLYRMSASTPRQSAPVYFASASGDPLVAGTNPADCRNAPTSVIAVPGGRSSNLPRL